MEFLLDSFVLELGTEPCGGWRIFLNHFLAGGGQLSLEFMAYLTFFFLLMLVLGFFLCLFLVFFFEVTEEQYNKKKRSGNLTLAFKCKL